MTSIPALSRPAVRPVQSGDWPLVRDVCLQMLRESPDAFGETLDEVRARTASDWEQFVERCQAGTFMTAFLAEDASGPCGFVRCDTSDPRAPFGTALLSQQWVAPHWRRASLGRRMLDAVTRWALERHATRLTVDVAGSFPGARQFYEAMGFSDTGARLLLPSRPSFEVIIMAKSLGAPARDQGTHQ